MTPEIIIATLNAAGQLVAALVPLVASAKDTLSSSDYEKVRAALADMQAGSDADWARVSALLSAE